MYCNMQITCYACLLSLATSVRVVYSSNKGSYNHTAHIMGHTIVLVSAVKFETFSSPAIPNSSFLCVAHLKTDSIPVSGEHLKMDDHMGRRTVGGLLFTKGGSILLFREDSARSKSTTCCTRHGCSSKHQAGKDRQTHRSAAAAAAAAKEAAETTRRPQIIRKPSARTPHQGSTRSDSVSSRNASSSCSENGNRPRETPGRDLIARLKERVNASRKRSLNRESSPSSPNGLCAASSSSSSSRSVSRPSRRAASRVRKADEGANANAGAGSVHRDRSGDTRRSSDRGVDDFLLVEQAARDQVHTEGFLSGFLARYRSDHQGGLPSLEDSMEDANGYWRFDVEGTEELENYFIFNDRHRGMRMDIDGMSYEELLALGERIGTVSTGLSEDALSKCLNRSMYKPTTSGTHEQSDRKCSICQEEYSDGEEVGKMACKHYYHISCIQNWLMQKNWCPICKSVALNTN
ncbi:hypothetical protein ABZP36_007942 [Zizania latifolia]